MGWCRTEAHVFLNGLTAVLQEWPFYCEYAAHKYMCFIICEGGCVAQLVELVCKNRGSIPGPE